MYEPTPLRLGCVLMKPLPFISVVSFPIHGVAVSPVNHAVICRINSANALRYPLALLSSCTRACSGVVSPACVQGSTPCLSAASQHLVHCRLVFLSLRA